jgi:hypothetical protein
MKSVDDKRADVVARFWSEVDNYSEHADNSAWTPQSPQETIAAFEKMLARLKAGLLKIK